MTMIASALDGKFRDEDWGEINDSLEEMDTHLWLTHHVLHAATGPGWCSPVTCAAKKAQDPDTPTWTEAMSGDEAECCWDAVVEEMVNMEKREVWEVAP